MTLKNIYPTLFIVKSPKFEFVVVRRRKLYFKMSLNGVTQSQKTELNLMYSSREQKKIMQALKLIEASQSHEGKHYKRKANADIRAIQPPQRKKVKTDSNDNGQKNVQSMSSPLNSSQIVSKSPLEPSSEIIVKVDKFLNRNYTIPEGNDDDLFNYLLSYSMNSTEQRMNKEDKDWTELNSINFKKIDFSKNVDSVKAAQKINLKFNQLKDKMQEPLGKTHRQFNQKIISKAFLEN